MEKASTSSRILTRRLLRPCCPRRCWPAPSPGFHGPGRLGTCESPPRPSGTGGGSGKRRRGATAPAAGPPGRTWGGGTRPRARRARAAAPPRPSGRPGRRFWKERPPRRRAGGRWWRLSPGEREEGDPAGGGRNVPCQGKAGVAAHPVRDPAEPRPLPSAARPLASLERAAG